MEEASRRAREISKRRKDIVLFLLGPGYPVTELGRRRWLKGRLAQDGINAIIMEDLPQWKEYLVEKFEDILRRFKPHLIIAIFTREGNPLGITFELGFLTASFGLRNLFGLLRYCVEVGVDERRMMTSYVREQLPVARSVHFAGNDGLYEAVLNFVDNYIIEQGWA